MGLMLGADNAWGTGIGRPAGLSPIYVYVASCSAYFWLAYSLFGGLGGLSLGGPCASQVGGLKASLEPYKKVSMSSLRGRTMSARAGTLLSPPGTSRPSLDASELANPSERLLLP